MYYRHIYHYILIKDIILDSDSSSKKLLYSLLHKIRRCCKCSRAASVLLFPNRIEETF